MAGTRWLDEPEEHLWRTFLEVSARVRMEIEAELKEDAGMTLADYEVLVHLSEAENRRLRMSELSEQTVHSQSRLSQRVDRLVRRGWLIREPCEDDRRGMFATLTDAGLGAIENAAPGHVRAVRKYFIDLVPEHSVEELDGTLSKVAGALHLPEESAPDQGRREA